MEMRLLLAFLLMGAVMFLTPYFFKSQPAARRRRTRQTAPPKTDARPPPAAEALRRPRRRRPSEAAGRPRPAAAPRRRRTSCFTIETDLYRVAFSNRARRCVAGCSRSIRATTASRWTWSIPPPAWISPSPCTSQGQARRQRQLDLVRRPSEPDGLGVTYEFSDGHVSVRKVSASRRTATCRMVSTEVTLDGKPLPHMMSGAAASAISPWPTRRPTSGPCASTSPTEQADRGQPPKAAAKRPGHQQPATSPSPASPITYFAAVFLPEGNAAMRDDHLRATPSPPPSNRSRCRSAAWRWAAAHANRFEALRRARRISICCSAVNPKLEQVVDFGWFAFLAKPLFLIVQLGQRSRRAQLRLGHRAGHDRSSTSCCSR